MNVFAIQLFPRALADDTMAGQTAACLLLVLIVAILLSACGGSSTSQTISPIMLNSVSPPPTMNNPAFAITANGSGFIAGAVLVVVGNTGPALQLQTTVISPVQLTAAIPANTFTFNHATFQIYSPNTPCTNQYCNSQWSGILSVPVSP